MKTKQIDIAATIGESAPLVNMILSGKRKVSYRLAKKLKKLTGLDELFWMEATPEQIRKGLSILDIEKA